MFSLFIEKRAVRDVRDFSESEQIRILEKISVILAMNPFPVGGNPKRMKGTRAFRLRVGNYRILYTVEQNTVRVYAIGHRKDMYR